MTAPVQEPTDGRDLATVDFQARQLFRRPSATSGPGGFDWITYQGSALTYTGSTTVDWLAGSDEDIQSTTPDFYVDTGSPTKMRFDRLGCYMIQAAVIMDTQPTSFTGVFRIRTTWFTNGGSPLGDGFGGSGFRMDGTAGHPVRLVGPSAMQFFSVYDEDWLPAYATFILTGGAAITLSPFCVVTHIGDPLEVL